MSEVFRDRQWRTHWLSRIAVLGRFSPADRLMADLESPRFVYSNYEQYMNACIAQAKRPWPSQIESGWPLPPQDSIDRPLTESYDYLAYEQETVAALNRFLEGRLALRAFKLDHGSYPANLTDLTPTYLPAVPIDPFSDGQPLRYRRAGSRYLLYSIGPDAVDNGGRPVCNTQADTAERYDVAANELATGDIVAGVNF